MRTMNMVGRFASGRGHAREIEMLLEPTKQVEGRTICALGDAATWPIQALMWHFRPEVEARIVAFRREQGAVWGQDEVRGGPDVGGAG